MKRNIINIENLQHQMYREWLVTNGIGGFACGTICGAPTRKYHSFLNAALPAPLGRTVMLNYVIDSIVSSKNTMILTNIHTKKESELPSLHLKEFRLENGIPIWTYESSGIIVEKSLFFIHRQNTLCMSYKLVAASETIELKWRPYFHFRTSNEPTNIKRLDESYVVNTQGFKHEFSCLNFPELRIINQDSPVFITDLHKIHDVHYQMEEERGYESVGDLTSLGHFSVTLRPNQKTSFIISTESWLKIEAISAKEAYRLEKARKRKILKNVGEIGKIPLIANLILAADQFIITPYTRYQDMLRLQAEGEEARSVIAGFPWFMDWGRDTMISLEGLTLTAGRNRDAYAILNTFAYYVKDGLIPNMFPEGETKGVYNTADASLWFFHAIDRYIELTGDEDILESILPVLHEIIESHLKGTLYGIRADKDGLLIQGEENFQLTWMDAKVGDWVVTPRRGKAVEINALWYNALKLYELWSGKSLGITNQCRESFNQKFWHEGGQYLFDVIEGPNGNDPAIRPNQLFAISLRYPILDEKKWGKVLEIVKRDLLTPVGLRTLSSNHPDYKAYYYGDLRSRDASYHQGTVWPWLLGPFIDVWLKVYPDDFSGAYDILKGLEGCLTDYCIGTVGEIFDGTSPYKARGCFAQAWSVAEFLRCLMRILPKLPLEKKQ